MKIEKAKRVYSNLVQAVDHYEHEGFVNYNFESVLVKGTETFDPLGIPVIWSKTAGAMVPYVDQPLDPEDEDYDAEDSPLGEGKIVVGLVVGNAWGYSQPRQDVTLTSTGVYLTVLYRGKAHINPDEIQWNASTSTALQKAFMAALVDSHIVRGKVAVEPTVNVI